MVQRSIFEGMAAEQQEEEARPQAPGRSIFEGLQPPQPPPRTRRRTEFAEGFPFDPEDFGAPTEIETPEIPWYRRMLGEGGQPRRPAAPTDRRFPVSPGAHALAIPPEQRVISPTGPGWEGPEPPQATRFKEFMGKSLVPQLSENIEQRIRIAQDRPETGPGAIDPWESIGLLATGAPAAPYQFRDVGPIEAGATLGASDLVEQMMQPQNLAFIAAIPIIFRVPALAMMAQAGITVSILKHVLDTR